MNTTRFLVTAVATLCLAHGFLLADPADVQCLFEEANQARIEDRADEARTAFEKLFAQAPGHVEGHEAWQNMRWSEGGEEDLLKEYAAYLEENSTADAYFLLARITLDPEKREALLRQGLEKDPEHVKLNQYWVAFLIRQGRFEELDNALEKVLKLTPRDVNVHLVDIYRRKGKEEIAELDARYREAIRSNPDDYLHHLLLGSLMAKANRFNEALVAYERAYQLAPENEDVLRGRIIMAFAMRLPGLMETLLAKYEEKDSREIYFHQRSQLTFLKEDTEIAIADGVEAVRLAPLVPAYRQWLSFLYLATDKVDEAEEMLTQALRMEPNDAHSMGNLGGIYYKKGEYEKARDLMERHLQIDPASVSHYNLAKVYLKLGLNEEAQEAIAKGRMAEEGKFCPEELERLRSLSADASEDVLLNALALQLAQDGDYEESRDLLTDLAERYPDSYTNHIHLARLESRAFRNEETALEHWKQAEAPLPDGANHISERARIAEGLAWCHEALGQSDEAVSVLETFLQGNQEYVDADRLSELVDRMKIPMNDQERFQLDGVQVKGCLRDGYCLPTSLATVLAYWEMESDPHEIGRHVRETAEVNSVMALTQNYLKNFEDKGIDVRFFAPNLERIKTLLKAGCPVMLIGKFGLGVPPEFASHATVVSGFDDRTEHLILEDANWFSGFHYLDYSYLQDLMAWVIAPNEKIEEFESELPGHEYFDLVYQSDILSRRGELDEAIDVLEDAKILQNDLPFAYYQVGSLYFNLGEYEDAEWEWTQAARSTIHDSSSEIYLGSMAIGRNMHFDAIHWLEKALEKEPRRWDAHRSLAFSLYHVGRNEEAIVHIKAALEWESNSVESLNMLGICQFQVGDIDEAMETFTRSHSIQPTKHSHVGLARILQNRFTETKNIEDLEKAEEHLRNARAFVTLETDIQGIDALVAKVQEAREAFENEANAAAETAP